MRAYVVFSSSEPVLVLTRQTIRSKVVLDELRRIGCLKFIAREVPVDTLRIQYGQQYDVIEEAVLGGCPLRVLDYSGHRIFRYLPFSDFGPAYRCELPPKHVVAPREAPSFNSRPSVGPVPHPVFG